METFETKKKKSLIYLDNYDERAQNLTSNIKEEENYKLKAMMTSDSNEQSIALAQFNTANNELFYHFIYNDVLMKHRGNIEDDF